MVEIWKYKKGLWRTKIAGGISYGLLRFLNGSIWNYLYPPSHVYVADGVQETDLIIKKSREYEEKVRSPNNISLSKEQYNSL